MSTKSTFTLDEVTVQTIRRLAAREDKPQSLIVREAVAHYAAKDEKATPEERERWLKTFDELSSRVAERSPQSMAAEVATVKQSRRSGWTRRSGR
jgi:predicted transcriptional regulator